MRSQARTQGEAVNHKGKLDAGSSPPSYKASKAKNAIELVDADPLRGGMLPYSTGPTSVPRRKY